MRHRFGAVVMTVVIASLMTGQTVLASEGDAMDATTIVVDLQPDPATLTLVDSNGDGAPSANEFFVITGNLYEPGTDTDIGDFICRGVFLADIGITALDEAPTVTGGVAGQISQVQQTYILDGRGSLEVLGTEPGLPGLAISGGTGDFVGAIGNVLFEGALGATLDPASVAAPAAGVDVSFLSARLTFTVSLPS